MNSRLWLCAEKAAWLVVAFVATLLVFKFTGRI